MEGSLHSHIWWAYGTKKDHRKKRATDPEGEKSNEIDRSIGEKDADK